LTNTLRHIILTHLHPRTLIQITVQILSVPEDVSLTRPSSHLPALPALLQSAVLALLSASIPLSQTLTSTLVSLDYDNKPTVTPSAKQIAAAKSVHVFAFSSFGDVLVAESEGSFGVEDWEQACEEARRLCVKEGESVIMEEDGRVNLSDFVKGAVGGEVQKANAWRNAG